MKNNIVIKNSLTGKSDKFEPLKAPEVNIYTCGVTVYDDCHIGHARSLYIFDVMRRYLEFSGFRVNFVRNITDVDDKIINRANELKVDWNELVNKYIRSYKDDLKSLGIRAGLVDKDGEEPRATKSIDAIKAFIQVLIDKEYAYVTKTGVYFSVRKFRNYGGLSGQSVDQMLVGVRKEADETKADPLDFALWKASKPGEPSWPSDWGSGRPGWHIECSAMSTRYLKTDTLDIHAGGRDLIFPHHENEIAQSEAASGKQFAKYWIHHGLLTIDGQKMSKSLGNFITIKDFLGKYKDPDLLKFFFLSAHYASPIDYTEEKIEEAKKQKERILNFLKNNRTVLGDLEKSGADSEYDESAKELTEVRIWISALEAAMDGDFNMPQAIANIFNIIHYANSFLIDGKKDRTVYMVRDFSGRIVRKYLDEIFGLDMGQKASTVFLSDGVEVHDYAGLDAAEKKLLDERNIARKKKDYARADDFRKALLDKGVVIEDAKERIVCRRKS